MCVTAAAKILENIMKEDPTYSIDSLFSTLDGLTKEEESTVRESFKNPTKEELVVDEDTSPEEADEDEDKVKIKTPLLTKQEQAQPAAGQKTGAKGQVAWKFGGHTCYGMLISRSETETQCFAKTHKGNTKILTKGLSSWWLLG
jgi:hypothetical protein